MFKIEEKQEVKKETVFKIKAKKKYGVYLENNSKTHFEAVMDVLTNFFELDQTRAKFIMNFTHKNGKCLIKAFGSKEIVETVIAKAHGYCLEKYQQNIKNGRNQYYELLQFSIGEAE